MTIDAHHHYWNYNPAEYDWIDDRMKTIRKNFLPEDLRITIEDARVDGVISVQARQTIEETDWLLDLATQHDFMKGVVGWLPIVSSEFNSLLEKYASHDKLVALRHVLQGEPDDSYVLRTDFNEGIAMLKNYKLAYDILVYERHLPNIIKFADKHPDQVFILDHIAKPHIADGALSPWDKNIRQLARRDNVYCKISGMVTEADFHNWTEEQLEPYFEIVLEAFKPERLMFGSDWPVCLVGIDYSNWINMVQKAISKLSVNEQSAIMGENALKAYRIM